MGKIINQFVREGELLDGLRIIGDDFEPIYKEAQHRLLMVWAPFLLVYLILGLIVLLRGLNGI